jgi:hypothetical protein
VLLLGAAVAALGGCGSSPAKSNAPATASVACTELHTAAAARAARCTGGALADWMAYEASAENCADYDIHVREGNVVYQRDKFDACVAEYDLACDHTFNCFYAVLHGLTPDGQACRDTEVCGTDSACLSLDGASCDEKCVRAGVENEACGLYCGDATPCLPFPICRWDFVCANNVCVKGKKVGDACDNSANTVPCTLPAFCSAGTCTLPVSGGACRADSECPTTEFCAPQGTCAARRAAGVACSDAPTACAQWTTCDTSSGSCVPAGKPGAVCQPVPGSDDPTPNYCMIGFCGQDGRCIATSGPGGPCDQSQCAVGTSCDPSTVTCMACP